MITEERLYTYGDGTTKTMIRIHADAGKAVTNDGVNAYASIDVENTDGWYEIDDPDPVPDTVSFEDIAQALEEIA